MARGVDNPQLRERLGVPSFEQRWPWIGGDLQTLRDTLREVDLPTIKGFRLKFPCQPCPVERRLPGRCWPCSISRKGTPRAWFCCSMGWVDPVPGKA